MIEQWKDPDGGDAAPHPAGEVDLAGAHGGLAAATNGFITAGCCYTPAGSAHGVCSGVFCRP